MPPKGSSKNLASRTRFWDQQTWLITGFNGRPEAPFFGVYNLLDLFSGFYHGIFVTFGPLTNTNQVLWPAAARRVLWISYLALKQIVTWSIGLFLAVLAVLSWFLAVLAVFGRFCRFGFFGRFGHFGGTIFDHLIRFLAFPKAHLSFLTLWPIQTSFCCIMACNYAILTFFTVILYTAVL